MVKKNAILLSIFFSFILSAYGEGLKREYKFKFDGWKYLKPTQICSLLDMVIILQNAQKKLEQGELPETIALFEGEIPSPDLKPAQGSAEPADVAKMMSEALTVFQLKTGTQFSIPPIPDRKLYPADVLVYASLAFDFLGKYLEGQGIRKIGDFSLLRYRYTTRLRPPDCLSRATLVLENWKNL